MKHVLIALLLVPAWLVGSNLEDNVDSITNAIRKGDVAALAEFLGESVELAILDDEDTYDKEEALAVLQAFFASNKPNAFSRVHHGTSKGQDAQYCIGSLTAGGTSYRVYLYLKVEKNRYIIEEFRVDED